MITNVIDKRKHKYRWGKVDAVVEPTWHDNTCKGAEKARVVDDSADCPLGYDDKFGLSLAEARRAFRRENNS